MRRVQTEIILGILFVLISAGLLAAIAVKEEDRLSGYEEEQLASRIEYGAGVFETNCTGCHGEYAQGIPGKAPCLRCDELFSSRLDEIGWGGTLEDYIVSVVTTGRQISTRPELYQGEGLGPPVMPTWSEEFGGPLREDQIRAVAAFIVNFEPWAMDPELVPTPVFAFDPDDPTALGRLVFVQMGCIGCHTVAGLSEATTGPVLDGVATRGETRKDGYTAEDYIRESILDPGAYVVEGFDNGLMPVIFGETISEEDLDNLVAFLLTLTEE
jgi:mono/diheme cytochrome c family protein